jgi:hypothetical protein
MIFDQRIAERAFGMDPIQVAPPAATTLDVAGVLKIAQDAVRVALGNTGGSRYVRDSQVRPLGNREQYLSVIRDERPVPLRKHLMQLGPGRNRLRHQHTVPLRNGSDNPPDGLTSVEFGQRSGRFLARSRDAIRPRPDDLGPVHVKRRSGVTPSVSEGRATARNRRA